MPMYEVIFETEVYASVFINAEDADEAQDKALDQKYPTGFAVPNGYELADEWHIGGIVRVRDED